ncbi:MAG: alpha-glucosidase [Saprospiraceae bacterium]|nr:MAG: alpha-glucosidase [Saprospiraceae bacterium]
MEQDNQSVSEQTTSNGNGIPRPGIVHIDETPSGVRHQDVQYSFIPNTIIESYQEEDASIIYRCQNGIALKVQVVSRWVFRFRYALEGEFLEDFSYALVDHWRDPFPKFTIGGNEEAYFINTGVICCYIDKKDLRVKIVDAQDQQIINEDAEPFFASSTIMRGLDEIRLTKKAQYEEVYFGLGDKSCNLNLRGQKLKNWNTDSFSFSKDTDPLYRSIPFYYGLQNGKAYGIFLHNTWRTHFDFDSQQNGQTSFYAEGGEMDYFFIYGSSLLDVASEYTHLTGKPELPPLWALGFHQCRWSYYPESRVREVAAEFRERQIPCDAIYLDIDYMNGYRCFTWNKSYFPDPPKMIADLAEKGFQTVVMIDPGIRVDENYEVYKEGIEKDLFCRRTSGEVMKGPVWPSVCAFPDFTNPATRAWWQQLYRGLYLEDGVSGFWNDMNEPAIFKIHHMTFPDNVLHDFDGLRGDHRKAHNIYGQQMARSTFGGLKVLQPEKRPFLLTRASFSGGQRFASVWTGDNIASWEHLRLANIQCQRLSISGFSFVGTDIGGFVDMPDGELFVRWLQLAAFHPLYRVHSMGNNTDGAAEADADAVQEAETSNRMDQEPWAFGEPYTELAKVAISFRYKLLPYLYTAFRQYVTHGIPVLKPLSFVAESDPEALKREEEFMVGDALLVSPVLETGIKEQQVYLPAGVWLNYYEGTIYEGGQFITSQLQDDRLPIFVKAGAVIPNFPVMQYSSEKTVTTPTLRVYSGTREASPFYEDAGEGYGYQNGGYRLRNFQTTHSGDQLSIVQELEGRYNSPIEAFQIEVFGLDFVPGKVTINGAMIPFEINEHQISFQASGRFDQIRIEA